MLEKLPGLLAFLRWVYKSSPSGNLILSCSLHSVWYSALSKTCWLTEEKSSLGTELVVKGRTLRDSGKRKAPSVYWALCKTLGTQL